MATPRAISALVPSPAIAACTTGTDKPKRSMRAEAAMRGNLVDPARGIESVRRISRSRGFQLILAAMQPEQHITDIAPARSSSQWRRCCYWLAVQRAQMRLLD